MITESDVSPNPSTKRQHALPKKNKPCKKQRQQEENRREAGKKTAERIESIRRRKQPPGATVEDRVGDIASKTWTLLPEISEGYEYRDTDADNDENSDRDQWKVEDREEG